MTRDKGAGKPEKKVRRRFSDIPLRATTGAYILNAGVTHFQERDRAADLHKAAMSTFPPFEKLTPDQFLYVLAGTETALGAALLAPFVNSKLAGLGLLGFSGSLLAMYAKQEQFRRSVTSVRPSREGEAIAKDAWMFGIGLALLMRRRVVKSAH